MTTAQNRRNFILMAGVLAAFAVEPAWAADEKGKEEKKEEKKKKEPKGEEPKERYQTGQFLQVLGVTAPMSGNGNKQVAMNLMIDMGSQPEAVAAEERMPKVLSVLIIELNKEPLGQNGRLGPDDLDLLKQRLLVQANRVLGGKAKEVLIRNIQEVKKFRPR